MAAVTRAFSVARDITRGHFFYGWYIVGLAILSWFFTAGIQVYSLTVFLKPMTEDLGWSRGAFSGTQSASTVVQGLIGFMIGGLVDRYGGRWLMIFGAVVAGFSLIALSQVQELWQFYVIRSVVLVIGSACMGNLVVNVTLSKWFVRMRGTAIAIAAMGTSLGGVAMVPLVTVLVSKLGWREAWIVIGVMVWVMIIVPAALIMRRQPEDMGLLPDGDTPESLAARASRTGRGRNRLSIVTEEQWTRQQAVRTRALWLLVISWGIANTGLSGMILHGVPFLTDAGFSRETAAFLFSSQAMAAMVCKPIWGYLVDRIQPRYLAATSFLLAGCAVLALLRVSEAGSVPYLMPVMIVWGISIGGTIPLQETVWASYFGRQHIGSIRAVAMPFSIVFGSSGPLLAGLLYDSTGSYVVSYTIFATMSFIGMVMILFTRPPRRVATVSEATVPA